MLNTDIHLVLVADDERPELTLSLTERNCRRSEGLVSQLPSQPPAAGLPASGGGAVATDPVLFTGSAGNGKSAFRRR